MQKIPWTEHVNNEDVLRENRNYKETAVRKRQLKRLGDMTRKEGLENVTLTGHNIRTG